MQAHNPQADVILTLLQGAVQALKSREREIEQARERVDDLMRQAYAAGATTVAIAHAARRSRTTVHKALTSRSHRKPDAPTKSYRSY